LAKEQYTAYIKRRDSVCAQIHTSQESKVTTLCNQQGKTDRNMHNDKADSITRDNKAGVKVKESCNRPAVVQRVPGGLDSQIS